MEPLQVFPSQERSLTPWLLGSDNYRHQLGQEIKDVEMFSVHLDTDHVENISLFSSQNLVAELSND